MINYFTLRQAGQPWSVGHLQKAADDDEDPGS